MPTAAAASAGPQHPPTNITALPWRTLSQLAAAEGSIRHHERVRKARAAAREREEGLELVYSCGNATNTAAATRGGKRGASSASKNSRQHSAGPLSSTAAAAAKYNNNTSTKNNSFQQQRPLLADTTQAATLGGLVKERRRRSDSAPSRPITAATADNSKLSLTERLANPPPQPHSRLAYMRGRNDAAAAAREATVEQRRLRSRHQHALVTRGALAAARSGSARNAEERKAATGARRQRFLLQEDDVYGDDTHRNYGVGDDGDDDVFAPYDINGAYAPSSPSAATADGQRMYRSMRGERPSYSPHRSTSRGVTRGRPVANARDGSPMRGRGQGDTSSSAALYFPDEEAFEAYFVEHWRGDEASGGRVGGPHSLLNESGGGLSAFGITRRRRGQRPSAAGSSRSGSVSRSTSVSMGDSRSNSLSMANSSQQSRANNNDNISGHGAQNKSRGEAMGEGEGGANGVSGEHNNSSSSPLAAKGLTPLALPLRPNAAASRLSLQPARRHHQDDTNHLHLVSSDEGGGGDLTARAEDDGVPPSDYAVAAPAALRTEPMPLTSRPSSRPPTEQTQRQKSGAKSAVNSKGSYDTAADLAEYAAIRVDGGDEGAPTCNAHNRREEGSDDDSAFFGHRSHPHQQHLLHSGREREEDTSNNHSADTNAANANNASAVSIAPSGASLRRPSSVRASVSAFFADGDSGNSTNAEESSSDDDDDAPPVVRDERLRQMAERLNISYTEIAPTNLAFEEATSSSDEGDATNPRPQVKGVPAKKQKRGGKEESKKKGRAQAGEEKHHPLSTIDASLLTPLFDPSAPSVCVALASFRHHWRRAIGAAETKGRTALIAAEGKAFSSLVYYFSTGHDAVAAREASVGKWAVVIATAEAAHRRKVIEVYFTSLDTLAFSEASARRKLSKFLARRLAKRGDTSEDAVALRRAAAMVGLEEALRSAVTADESPATSTTVAIRGKSSTTAAAVNPQRIGTAGLSTAATRRDKLASSSSALPHPSAPAGRLGGAAPPPAISSNASDRPPTAGSTCPAAASSSSVVDGKRRVGSAAGRFGGSATTKGAASRPQTSDSAAIGANGLPTVTPSSSAAAAVPHSANPNSANSVTARELRQRDERWLHEARRFTDGLRRELYANAWRSGGGAGGTNTEDPAPNRTRTGDTETDGEGAGKKKRVTKKKQLSHSPNAEKTAKAKEKKKRRREKRRGEEAEAKSGAPPALSAAVRARAAKVFDDRQQTAAAAERRADRIHRRLSRMESEGDLGEAYDAMFWGGGGGPEEEGPPSRVGGRALTKYYYRGLAIAPAPAARLREKGSIADGPTATDRKKGLPLEATEDVPNTRFFLLPMGASTDASAINNGHRRQQGPLSTVHRQSVAIGKGEGANDEAPIISFVQRTEDPSEHLLTAGGGSAHLREPSEASSGSALLLASEQNPNPSSSGGAHGGGGVRLSLTPPPGSQQQHAAHLLLHNAGGGVPSSTGGGLSANNGATTTRSSRSSHRSRSPDGGATPSDGGGIRTPNASYMYLRTHSNGGASSTATTAMTGSVCAYGQRSGFVGIGGGGGGLSASHHSFGLGNSHNHNQSPETARRRRRMRHYLPADADDDAATGGNAAADDGTHSGRSSPSLAAADNIDAPAPATRQGGGGVRFAPQRSGVFGERIRRAQAMLQQQQQQNSKGTATASDRAAVGSPTPQQPLSSLGGSPSSSPMKGTKEQRGDADGVTKNREAKKGGGGGGSPTSALRPPSNSAAWLAAEEGQPSGNQHDEEGSHFSVGGDTLQQHKKRGEVSERRRGPPVAVLLVDDGDNGEGESERLSRRSARPTSSAAGGSAADAAACRTASMASAVSAASSSQRTAVSGLSDHGGRRALGYLPQPSEADAEKGTEGEGARLFHPTSFYRTVNGGVGATPAGGEDGDATNNARRRPTAIARAIAAAAAAQTKYYSVEEEGGEETHTLHAPRNGAYDDSDGDAENRRTDIDVSGAHQAPMSDGSASSSTTHPDPFEAAAAAMQRHTTMQLRIAGRHVRAASESSDSDQQSWELGADDF